MLIKIKYHDPDIAKLGAVQNGDWIDLRAAEDVVMEPLEFRIIPLGVSIKLPEGYEGHLAPRSSTFKNFGILQTNGVGVVDESYCGDDDVWGFPALAIRHTEIHKGDRICQFRIMKKMDDIQFVSVDSLDSKSRGGFGSTGKQ